MRNWPTYQLLYVVVEERLESKVPAVGYAGGELSHLVGGDERDLNSNSPVIFLEYFCAN